MASKSTFQDSLSCLNYADPSRCHPCSECHLLSFVSPEHRTQDVPCHFIPLNTEGETIEDLELQATGSLFPKALDMENALSR